MQKYLSVCVALVAALLLSATPAQAAALRVSAKATATASKVTFVAKPTRRATVTVIVYRGTRALRTMRTVRKGSVYSAVWNHRDARGNHVRSGVYAYRVAVVAGSKKAVVRGKVSVPAPTPAPTPTPAVTPAPTAAPAVTPVPVAAAANPAVASRWVGFYVPGAPASLAPLTSLEAQIGTRAAVSNFFISDAESFPLGRSQAVVDHGAIPMVTLEFWSTQNGGLASIISGNKDAYLTSFADDAKAFGRTVYLRPFHEMNGNWYPWAGTVGNNSPTQLVAAWRHVQQIFVARGATNVKFVWNVNNDSVPNVAGNTIESYYPGDAYVDFIALDGYNFGTYASWSSWRTFGSVFGNAYTRVTALTTKPLFIAETGSVEVGGDKAAWIANMFQVIPTTYPRITGVCWFNALKGEDWRAESSAASLAAFTSGATRGF